MEKFTVILLHYNQMEYIEQALKSVFKQTYNNIELIIADDCSKQFNQKKVEELIKKHNKKNFQYKILRNAKNIGTVKNINNTIKKSSGDYILFFAADDKLTDNKVIEQFVKEFKNTSKNVVTAQCEFYDSKIRKKFNDFVNSKQALKLNKKNSNAIYEKMCEGCFYGAGATAYRKIVFEKYGLVDEKYKYVEDWSYWLYILRNGEKIYYSDFSALQHRDGGISHSTFTKKTLPPHVRQYYIDILNIYETEVIPYLNRFTTKQKYKILRQYNETILYYASFAPELVSYLKSFDHARLSDSRLKYYWKSKTLKRIINPRLITKLKSLILYNRVVPITAIIWLISCLIVNQFNIANSNILLLIYLLMYTIIYCTVYSIDKIIFYMKMIRNNQNLNK